MPRGRKKTHKGGHRQFTSADDLARQQEKERKEREWREKKGIDESDEDDEEPAASGGQPAATNPAPKSSDNESDDDEEDDDDESDKPKGVGHLIEIENPNHVVRKTKKVSQLDTAEASLSRREREEVEKQRAKENYMKMHLAGKTDEARADLARLALIRKQREDAAKKRDEEKKSNA